jgi:hypothetical protein
MRRSQLIDYLLSVDPHGDPVIYICGANPELITYTESVPAGDQTLPNHILIDNTYSDEYFATWDEPTKEYIPFPTTTVLFPQNNEGDNCDDD